MAKTKYMTQEDAEKAAKKIKSIKPTKCFMYEDPKLKKAGTEERFLSIPGTGCAHWVAHEKGYKGGSSGAGGNACSETYYVNIDDILKKVGAEVKPEDVKMGDVWIVKESSKRHCGVVTTVKKNKTGAPTIKISQSGTSGFKEVSWDWFKKNYAEGKFYKG